MSDIKGRLSDAVHWASKRATVNYTRSFGMSHPPRATLYHIKLDANIQCIYHSILIHISCIYQSTRGRTSTRRQECTRRAHIRRHRNSLSSRCNLCPSTCKSAAQTSQQPRHIAHRCAPLTQRERVCCLLVLLCVERRGRCRSLRTSGRARSGALSRMVLTLHDIGTSSLDCTRHVHCSKDMLAPQPCLPRSAGFAQICAPGRVCVSKQGPTVTSIYMQVECACTAA